VRSSFAGPHRRAIVPPRAMLEIPPGTERSLPQVGLAISLEVRDPSILRQVVDLEPGHLRMVCRDAELGHRTEAIVGLAEATGIGIELVVLVDSVAAGEGLSKLPSALLRRLVVLPVDGTTASSAVLQAVRRVLDPIVPLIGGAANDFAAINRASDLSPLGDGIAFAVSPQAHLDDERSMIETLEVQTLVVEAARRLHPSRRVVVTPVTLRYPRAGSPRGPDPRLCEPFGAAWTIGSYLSLWRGGATSISFHEPAELYLDGRQRWPAVCEVLRSLARLGGRPASAVRSSRPREVLGMVLRGHEGARELLTVNLSSRSTAVEVVDGAQQTTLELDGYEWRWVSLPTAVASNSLR
jgi:hypothetical protein